MPGRSFFKDIKEVLPGTILKSGGSIIKYYNLINHKKKFDQEEFESILLNSIEMHQLSDVDVVSLISGGLDSAVITAGSKVQRCYTVGSQEDNEFEGAQETAAKLSRKCISVNVDQSELVSTWKRLTRLKGEPISLPNEGLIYHACSNMPANEKVVLTGEGADEILFGYDNIYRWANSLKTIDSRDFLGKYGYSENMKVTQRFSDYVEELNCDKSPVQFVEDFFINFHLPGLLRRMDFASMAASKEARVPFVSKDLIEYMYRQEIGIKLSDVESKIPLRRFARKLGLLGALNRKKIGFSAKVNNNISNRQQYKFFQSIVMEELKW
jgi:asparagine synthase (glutamine-hydrolysing)